MDVRNIEHPFIGQNLEEGALRTKVFRWILSDLIDERRTLIDLGAGPCVFAKHAANAGYRVTAVDGRTVRVPDDLGPYIDFVEEDVRKVDLADNDVVAILGLLYHLTLDDQIELLGRVSDRLNRVLILDTQVHFPGSVQVEASAVRGDWWKTKLTDVRGYTGVSFPEDNNPMASIGNPQSFWHTEPSLLFLLENSGFESVKIVDPLYISKYGARKFYIATTPALPPAEKIN